MFSTRGAEETAPKKVKKTKKVADSDDEAEDGDEDFMTVGKGGKSLDLSKEGIFKTLKTIQEARGKKNTDRREQVSILTALLKAAATSYQKLRVLLTLLSTRFDFNPSSHTHMPLEDWANARVEITQMLDLLVQEDGSYLIVEDALGGEDVDEMVERIPNENGEGKSVKIRGSLIALVDRLDEEFTKSLQWIDAHGMEYVERLKDESVLYQVLGQTQQWFETTKEDDKVARIVLRRLEHIYSKVSSIVPALRLWSPLADPIYALPSLI